MPNPILFLNELAPRPGVADDLFGLLPEKINYLWALTSGLIHRLHHEGHHEQADEFEHGSWVMDASVRMYKEKIEVAVLNYAIYVQDLEQGDGRFASFERNFILALLRVTTLLEMRREIEGDLDDLITEVEAQFGVNPWQGED